MDRVRLGRALGFGARQAAKTLVSAVDAATSANPPGKSADPGHAIPQRRAADFAATANSEATAPTVRAAAQAAPAAAISQTRTQAAKTTARTIVQTREVKSGLKRGSRRFGEAVWGPFVRLSGVLWLEVTGVFFGVFALLALGSLWKLRGAWHATANNAAEHRSLMGALVMLAIFGYFCISSFVRARRRERRR